MGSVRRRVAAGGTVVSVLHELGVALHADDIVVLDAGRLLHQGGARDDATLRAVEAVFGQRIGIARIGGQPVITWRT
jgi:iron complex transport system ATP-binding protein